MASTHCASGTQVATVSASTRPRDALTPMPHSVGIKASAAACRTHAPGKRSCASLASPSVEATTNTSVETAAICGPSASRHFASVCAAWDAATTMESSGSAMLSAMCLGLRLQPHHDAQRKGAAAVKVVEPMQWDGTQYEP